ncbi:MAG: STAS domain-containing protein [Atopobiaceae bacterium]|nr:STAS domain-containing protein [Atopobiaceae bacterium]
MEITITQEGAKAIIALNGKLSVATSPDLEAAISGLPESTNEFVIDLSQLEYISSAGLRVLVSTEKLANQRSGSMVLLHPNDEVLEVFDMTGLTDIFTIEK